MTSNNTKDIIDMDLKTWRGECALHLAAERGHDSIVELLLAEGFTIPTTAKELYLYGLISLYRRSSPSKKVTNCSDFTHTSVIIKS